ncbi:MAG: hypothetical protein JSU92_09720 [Deltaproteobacteria bacterium]|nr:MAG: hypothetical protein JSU92_09720 [Deltaproteobacteria bacterium]
MKRSLLIEKIVIFLSFTVLTLALTYPGILRISTHFMCDTGDGFSGVWNLWWLKTALLELHTNPFYTTYFYYPNGVNLLLHNFTLFYGLISIPLQYLFKMEVVYNLLVLSSFIIAGFGMYLLSFYLTDSRPAAFIAGIIYTFCPYHFGHGLGQLHMISLEWIPFYVLYLFKTFQQGGPRNAFLTGFFLILITFCSWYYLFYSFFFMILFLTYQLIFNRSKVLNRIYIQDLFLSLLTFLTVFLPLLIPIMYSYLTEQFYGVHYPTYWSADLLSFFIPGAISTYGEYFQNIWSTFSGNTAENSNYIGYIVLSLAIYALIKAKEVKFWAASGLIFFILALGPYLRIMGVNTKIPLPYLLLDRYVPLFSFTGIAERIAILIIFCLAILTAMAIKTLSNKIKNSGIKNLIIVVISILIILEYLAVPYTTTKVEVPEFYWRIAKEPDDYAIIDIPHPFSLTVLYFQTIHRKKMVLGYVSRTPKKSLEFLRSIPIISDFFFLDQKEHNYPESVKLAQSIFDSNNIRYVILRRFDRKELLEIKDDLPLKYKKMIHRFIRIEDFLESELKLPVIYDDGGTYMSGDPSRNEYYINGGIKVYDCRGKANH